MIFIDSNIPMYASGSPSPQKQACLRFLEKILKGKIEAASSAEVLQEILHRYRAINRLAEGILVYNAFRSLPLRLFEITAQDTDAARDTLQKVPGISSRDSLHVAVMQRHHIKKILTYDQDFNRVSGITVVSPE
jgi:predicted nucleic acid-binding protein